MIIEHWIWTALGHPDLQILTYVMNFINYAFIDFSLPVLYKVGVALVNKTCGKVALILGITGVGLSPWGCLTYSDTLAFSLSIFTVYVLINFHSFNNKYVSSCVLGILFSIDFLIKPSIIIVFIAFAFFISTKSINTQKILSIVVFLITASVILGGFSIYRSRNNFVRVDSSKSFSMMHFAEMGIKGSGGYSNKDALRDMTIADPKTRNEIDRKTWIQEFKNKGIIGYQKFLMKKQINNIADPSFSWGKDGIPFIEPFNKEKGVVISQCLFMQNDKMKYNNFIMIICETVWLGVLLLVLVSTMDYQVASIKLTVVGFLIFLLIFEGGRSRYVLQFLPYILLLAGSGYSLLTSNIKHIM